MTAYICLVSRNEYWRLEKKILNSILKSWRTINKYSIILNESQSIKLKIMTGKQTRTAEVYPVDQHLKKAQKFPMKSRKCFLPIDSTHLLGYAPCTLLSHIYDANGLISVTLESSTRMEKTNLWDNRKYTNSMGQRGDGEGGFNRRVHSALLSASNNGWSRPLHQSERSLTLFLWQPTPHPYKTLLQCIERSAKLPSSVSLENKLFQIHISCRYAVYKLHGT